ncbi:RelA/SpoT family protein [Sulfurovum sp. ST-21]|uniref:Bifunctional (P)ppGpp synthetase/guanosine-3',5'-bis(Diphosphate) 3'-pyrophosphohydrolase n=1 Tax=Sulfurovum indicum TaxID=2779528 RepID=A0A7M1S5S9_9BACT|nr:RelA/SpoT family protein [Sulfurovum indicum]QOR62514.1 bifunctional (p)ppGpp synthetase/guanosine-3',5'-bis(diphosphate) 3'-pyrophosphohydrolase [Sulfurovum indicum]
MDAFLAKVKEIHTIEEATALLWEQLPSPSSQTTKALDVAMTAHDGQKRKSGEPYIVHPILVAVITASISADETMVQAALLHDVVEDTDIDLEDLEHEFGEDVTHMVEGLTKIVEIRDEELAPSGSDDRLISSALTFRKMLIASIKDIRVLVIKLCDRLHNMLTLDALPLHKQKRIAEETLVVYSPIAHRLGISRLKNHLEDLSFYYIYPDDYAKIDTYIKANAQNLQFKLNAFIQKVRTLMEKNGFEGMHFEIIGRVKHYYSIYLKMHRKGVSIEEVLDLLAIRIIVNEPLECYKVLGLMHLNFTPLISRFKDYIAVPKENGYKTIHTTLFNEEGIVEAQIRTAQMHRLAEYGVAAHWKYKEGSNSVNLQWLESLSYQNESVEEFYELAKSDLFSEDITVFSPKGDYYTLPKGSVVLDFAYAIHSEVGANATGALVNKQKSSLLTVLKNGDIVRIIKDDMPHLHCSWQDAVKTSKAKEGIRSHCRARLKETDTFSAYNILATLFDQSVDAIKRRIEAMGLAESIHKLPTQLDFFKETIRKLAVYIGAKEVRFWELLKKGYKKPQPKKIEHFKFFTNKPLDGVEFDYCCHPKVGDKIVAFYKDSKAIIHHKLCKKAYAKILNAEPMIFVSWSGTKLSRYRLIISLQNQKGVLADLLARLSSLDMNVISIELGIKNSESAEYCRIEVESAESRKSVLEEKIAQQFKLIEMISLDDAYNK